MYCTVILVSWILNSADKYLSMHPSVSPLSVCLSVCLYLFTSLRLCVDHIHAFLSEYLLICWEPKRPSNLSISVMSHFADYVLTKLQTEREETWL